MCHEAQHVLSPCPLLQVIKDELMREVMPALAASMLDMLEAQPVDAIGFLADSLVAKADLQDAVLFDPYDAPIYEERRRKVEAKARRDTERARQAVERAERQRVAKLEADKSMYNMLLQNVAKHESLMRKA